MAITMFRGTQFKEATITQKEIIDGYVDLKTDQVISGSKTFNGAIISAEPKPLSSANGVVILDKSSNMFIVSGSENVSRIQGWSSGSVTIQWGSDRILKNSFDYLELQGGLDRKVQAGDLSSFLFLSPSKVIEAGFFSRSGSTQEASNITFVTIEADGVTTIPLNAIPTSKNMLFVAVNGAIQDPAIYEVNGAELTFSVPLEAGDSVFAFVIAKALAEGSIDIDGGVF